MTNKTILPIHSPSILFHGKTLFILLHVSFQKTTLAHRRVYVYKALWVTFKNVQKWNCTYWILLLFTYYVLYAYLIFFQQVQVIPLDGA